MRAYWAVEVESSGKRALHVFDRYSARERWVSACPEGRMRRRMSERRGLSMADSGGFPRVVRHRRIGFEEGGSE